MSSTLVVLFLILLVALSFALWRVERRRDYLRRTTKCPTCDGYGRINHRCGMVCIDDPCLTCGESGRVSREVPA